MDLRDNVNKANEVARENKVIGKDFEAKTTLYVTDGVKELFDSLNSDLRQILVASELNVLSLADKPADDESILDFDDMSIKVEHMPGEVCERCRITTEEIIEALMEVCNPDAVAIVQEIDNGEYRVVSKDIYELNNTIRIKDGEIKYEN